jgi:hypothetical protein
MWTRLGAATAMFAAASCGSELPESQSTTPAPLSAEYRKLEQEAVQLAGQGRVAEGAAILEKWIQSHPDDREPHFQIAFMLLSAVEEADDRTRTADRAAQLERAATHFGRFVELSPDVGSKAQGLDYLVQTYVPANLNRPAEAEPHARALVAAAPAWPQAYRQLGAVLRPLGRGHEASQLMLEIRESIAPDERVNYVIMLRTHVLQSPAMARDEARQLVETGLAVIDGEIAAGRRDYGTLSLKADLLELQATRVEPDGPRQKALLAESAELHKQAAGLLPGSR